MSGNLSHPFACSTLPYGHIPPVLEIGELMLMMIRGTRKKRLVRFFY